MSGKQLVVDACVARSAGTSSEAPQSTHSREALAAIRANLPHRLVFNAALRSEWDFHASRFAISFFAAMVSKRRVVFVRDDSYAGVLRGCAQQFAAPRVKEAFRKDAHVVAAALSADRIIISNEARLHSQLIQLANESALIADLIWANPAVEGDDCVRWILDGAEETLNRKIGSQATPPSHFSLDS